MLAQIEQFLETRGRAGDVADRQLHVALFGQRARQYVGATGFACDAHAGIGIGDRALQRVLLAGEQGGVEMQVGGKRIARAHARERAVEQAACRVEFAGQDEGRAELVRGLQRERRVFAERAARAVEVPLQGFLRGREATLAAQHGAELGHQFGAHAGVHRAVGACIADRLLDDFGDARRALARHARFGFGERAHHEVAHRVRALRGMPSAIGLPQRDGEGGEHGEHEGGGGHHAAAMTREELARAIPGGRWMGADRLRVEMAPDVLGECAGRAVAPFRLLGGRLHHDVVEVAAQLPAHFLRRRRQHAGCGRRIDLCRRRAGVAVAAATPGHQFAEEYTQRVDVGRGGDRAAVELFRRGVGRRHRGMLRAGGLSVRLRFEQLGDAEVEQLDIALAGDQHVRRFKVAMHDQRAVRGFDRAADLHEQREPLAQVERMLARVLGDRRAVDQLERDVRDAGIGDAAFDEMRDAGMAQLRQCKALGTEATMFVGRVEATPQQLQGHGLAHAGLLADRAEHDRGTAFAERVDQGERSDASTRNRTFRGEAFADACEQLVDRACRSGAIPRRRHRRRACAGSSRAVRDRRNGVRASPGARPRAGPGQPRTVRAAPAGSRSCKARREGGRSCVNAETHPNATRPASVAPESGAGRDKRKA